MQENLNMTFMLKEIEVARSQLHELATENSLTSLEVVAASVKLDTLLNNLTKIKYN